MCIKIECCILLCAQGCRKVEMFVLLLTQKQHLLWTIRTCSSQKKTIWSKTRKCWLNLILSNPSRKNEQTQCEKDTNLQLSLFLLLYSEKFQWGVKIPYCRNDLQKNHTVDCLTYEETTRKPYDDSLCLFRALALHLYGKGWLEGKTSIFFNPFLETSGRTDPATFQCVCMNDVPPVEDLLRVNVFWYDIGYSEWSSNDWWDC